MLEENLNRMRVLIDKSLSEVRMRADPEVHAETFSVFSLVDQILITAQNEANKKRQLLTNEVNRELKIDTDRQLLLSALANLIQNGMKYSKVEGRIIVRSGLSGANVVIEVEDQCGGIAPTAMSHLFKPFASGGVDQSGLGLGLTIVQRAVHLLQGRISVENNPGSGCAFKVEIPQMLTSLSSSRSVSGGDAVQPDDFRKLPT